jgi:Holliday junction resolvasome RuvABC ATP-dependent DNA helicase subunit
MREFIIDTNVPLVAQGSAIQMSDDCVINCVDFLEDLFTNKIKLVIDSDYHLIHEYENQMRKGTRLDYGNRFLKWIYSNQANTHKIKTVEINQLDEYNFEEVPPSLIEIGFDNSDRKFIAVAIANNNQAPVAQAADSKWIGWEEALINEGISVYFLCKEELRNIYGNKGKKKH